jgi:serine protease AprX
MYLSGTSIAAPAVAGAAAVLLQANPGLTPPLVKAILQYTAQPLPGHNLLQQGAGMLNLEGAVKLAQSLRTDIHSAVQAGTISAGANLLALGKTLPTARSSTIGGQSLQLVAHRLRGWQPHRHRRQALHRLPADLGPTHRVG